MVLLVGGLAASLVSENSLAFGKPASLGAQAPDTDGDGIPDEQDFCPDDANNDADGDGICASGGDCNDSDASVLPGAPEICDGVDNNCNGQVDEDGCDPAACQSDSECVDNDPCTLDQCTPDGCANPPSNQDRDADGLPDCVDIDDDNDGVRDNDDPQPFNPTICGDVDFDRCDDCTVQVDGLGPAPDFDPNNDGIDTDLDGICDRGDRDDDNDGVPDPSDPQRLDPAVCGDVDTDSCDDCTNQVDGFGPLRDFDPGNDGLDTDNDGICDIGDICPEDPANDSDGDGICDSVDPCPNDPTNQDSDGDGICDLVDPCPEDPINQDSDGDGICDSADPCPEDPTNQDSDGDDICDSVDPCPSDPTNQDSDSDGICATEDCNDQDPSVFPGAPEICDGLDNDCNGGVDEDVCDPACQSDTECVDNDPCTLDLCPPDGCSNPLDPDATDTDSDGICDLGDPCPEDATNQDSDGDGICDSAECQVGVDCSDDNPCTDDSCDPQTGCVNTNNTNPCDDGNTCTQTDICEAGICTGSNPVVCTALDQCHDAGVCDPVTGCSDPVSPQGAPCDDGNACTQTDICEAGICTGSNPVVCTALDQCHDAGVCDPVTGCSDPVSAQGAPCDDGNACTQTDICETGICAGSNPVEWSARR